MIVRGAWGNGKQDAWTEPGMPTDPTKDVRVTYGLYSVAPNPADGTIWGASQGSGFVTRFDPKTTLTEVYKLPPGAGGIRGGDIASDGQVGCGNYTALEILEVQPEGKRPMSLADFRNGRDWKFGMRLESLA